MKNQFVADVNDYFKYGLLRALSARGGLSPIGIWWMLTDDDAGAHGSKLDYLKDHERYGACDEDLYKKLGRIANKKIRHVFDIEKNELINSAQYWPCNGGRVRIATKASHEKLSDPYGRALDFKCMLTKFKDCPLIFADPDNGIETKSASRERHIRWSEIAALFDAGKSLVVYQHKAQGRSLDNDVPVLLKNIRKLLGKNAANAFSITCGRGETKAEIAFLLIPQPAATKYFRERAKHFTKRFGKFSRQIPKRGGM